MAALGVNPPDLSLVRVDWQQEGQPFSPATVDVAYIAVTLADDTYAKIRNQTQSGSPVTTTTQYTRVWNVQWVLYGPNAVDRARLIHSATFLDYFNDLLNLQQLFPVSDPATPTRVPEKINGQWYNRSDFSIHMNENVIETIQDGAVQSVEVLVNDSSGQVADFTVK